MRARWLLVAAVTGAIACDAPAPPSPPAALADHLRALAVADDAVRAREVAAWQLDLAAWDRTIVAPYRDLYDDYARALAAAAPALSAQLARGGVVTTRPHYADDPRLTLGQARARWALPVQFGSVVAELDGAPLDAVFVRDRGRWRALVGLDHAIRARVAALDAACAAHLDVVQPGRCSEIGWEIAEAALRRDRPRLTRACALATNLCAP